MKTKVKLNINLDIVSENKDKEQVEGAAYWLIEPFLEQFQHEAFDNGEYLIESYNIEIVEP